MRLTNYSSGLLEVYFGREWGYVCDDGWNEVNGDVVCSILGYEGANSSSGSHFSSDVNYKLNYIDCTGGEESLLNCTYSLYTSDVCSVSEHVFISCISGKLYVVLDVIFGKYRTWRRRTPSKSIKNIKLPPVPPNFIWTLNHL